MLYLLNIHLANMTIPQWNHFIPALKRKMKELTNTLILMMQKYQLFSILKVEITEKEFLVGLDLRLHNLMKILI